MEFTDVEFMTAAQKRTAFNAWKKFLKGDFQKKDFTKALYHHLTQHCSFIAHYDIHGFYATYFVDPKDTLRFMQQFWDGQSTEYGASYWLRGDYADINQAMMHHAQTERERIETNLCISHQENLEARAHAAAKAAGLTIEGEV